VNVLPVVSLIVTFLGQTQSPLDVGLKERNFSFFELPSGDWILGDKKNKNKKDKSKNTLRIQWYKTQTQKALGKYGYFVRE